MPGIVDVHPSSGGSHREVGKMAYNSTDGTFQDFLFDLQGADNLEELAQYLHSDKTDTVIDTVLSDESAPSSSYSSPARDESDESELPDSENAFDLDKIWNIPRSSTISGNMINDNSEGEPSDEVSKLKQQLKQPSSNPFMGMAGDCNSLLTQGYPLLEDHDHPNQIQNTTEQFSAWNHSPAEDEHLLYLISSSMNDSSDENLLPDTPSSQSGTVTDDSDVDIETITDAPRIADACGYTTHDSSPASSPANSPSPFHNHTNSNPDATLHRSSSSPVFTSLTQSSNIAQPSIRYNSCGVSNKVSLAENLMCGRPTVPGQKRKLPKEKKSVCKNNVTTFHHNITFQTSSSSVNFHDYAMSPISCTSIETAQPTIVTSKRLYKRRQLNTLDLSEKEKQHHHNQLERNRRQKLADLFMDLRDVVPNIAHNTKASKVMILNQATSYILDLQRHETSQVQQLSKEQERNRILERQKRQLELQMSSIK